MKIANIIPRIKTWIRIAFVIPLWTFVLLFVSPDAISQQREVMLSRGFGQAWLERRAEAERWAASKGRPVRFENADGTVFELQFIDSQGIPRYYRTYNANSAISISTNDVHTGGSLNMNLNGNGMTIHVWDAGHALAGHQELNGRYSVWDGTTSLHYHAGHVTGTLIASGVVPSAKGMAPQATCRGYEWNNDLNEMSSAAAAGALISSHSYGYVRGWSYEDGQWVWYGDSQISTAEDYLFGFYDSESRSMDQVAYSNPYYLIFKSAGNDRNDDDPASATPPPDGPYDCIGSEGIAKNIMTVGAVADVIGGYSSPSGVVMTSFSSWGPADDSRIKPDIVANGASLYSTDVDNTSDYATLSGTSMSCPSAAGSALLLQEMYQELHGSGNFMRASTLKGLIIHTADECGSSPGPDYQFGWGLMNTAAAALLLQESPGNGSIDEITLASGSSYTREIISDGTSPLWVTICWTDPAGTPVAASLDPTAPMLVNDLDLRLVHAAQGTFYPWSLSASSPSSPATRTGENNADNVEQVYIASPVAGKYVITVDHDGTLTGGSQVFSILISGQAVTENPAGLTAVPLPADPASQIRVDWQRNSQQDRVLLLWNTEPVFGRPQNNIQYHPGDPVDGGGMVLFLGEDTSLIHHGLASGTAYHYKAFSLDSSLMYSSGITATTTTTGVAVDRPDGLSAQVTGCGIVSLAWNAAGSPPGGFSEDFESYADFSLSFGSWSQVDGDLSPTYGSSSFDFTNEFYTGSFILFNPTQTVPANPSGWTAHGGNKYAACFSATAQANDDWLISPLVSISSGSTLRFWARSITDAYGLERFTVNVSTTGTTPSSFSKISPGIYLEAPLNWTEYVYDLSAYAGQSVHIGIHCISDDAFVFMVDDMVITASKSAPKSMPGYVIFRDGQVIDTVGNNVTTYVDSLSGYGYRQYRVAALYGTDTLSAPSAAAEAYPGDCSPASQLLETDFEAGLSGWTVYSVSGTQSWGQSTVRSYSGIYAAAFIRVTEGSDDFLISPALMLNGEGKQTLTYYENVDRANQPAQHQVYISSDYPGSGNPLNYTWTLLRDAMGTEDTWEARQIDLSAFTGSVSIAFRYTASGLRSSWFIDDVEVIQEVPCKVEWTGLADTDWSNPQNWASGKVPSLLDEVYLGAQRAHYPEVNGNSLAEAASLEIDRGAWMKVAPGMQLSVSGRMLLNGKLTMMADSQGTSSLIDGGVIEGTAALIAQQYFKRDRWHYFTSRAMNENTLRFDSMMLLKYHEPTGQWIGIPSSAGALLGQARGYALYSASSTHGDVLVEYDQKPWTGQVETETLSRTSSQSDSMVGYNLVGNPYNSALNWDASSGISRVNVEGAIYFWDPEANSGLGAYATYVGGVGNPATTRGIIAPGQGFFVRVEDGADSGVILMDNTARVHDGQMFYKSAGNANENILRLNVSANGFSDETVVRLMNGSSSGFDTDLDARKIFAGQAGVPQIYTHCEAGCDDLFSINTWPVPDSQITVPVGLNINLAGTYLLTFRGIESFPAGMTILLEDTMADIFHDLRQIDSLTITSGITSGVGRFLLHFYPVVTHGSLYYANASKTSLSGQAVELRNAIGNVHTSTLSDAAGNFSFTNLPEGHYTMEASISLPWKGVNASDAFHIARHFVGAHTLTGVLLRAGDVDGGGYVNTYDALLVLQRFTMLVDSFPAGDWCAGPLPIIVDRMDTVRRDFPVAVYGDVNASYSFLKELPVDPLGIPYSGIRVPVVDGMARIPFRAATEAELGALSIRLSFPVDMIRIEDVIFGAGWVASWSVSGDVLLLAAYAFPGMMLDREDVVFELEARLMYDEERELTGFAVLSGSEIIDGNGQEMRTFSLEHDQVEGTHGLGFSVHPNPVEDDLLNMDVRSACRGELMVEIFDLKGRRLSETFHELLHPRQEFSVDVGDFSPGVYLMILSTGSGAGRRYATGKVVIGFKE